MNWIRSLQLKKEANLLDSKWFILKTFLAIGTGFLVFSHVPFVNRDMITVLFGLVLTLEPVNTAGLKNGWDQVFASFVGAASTSLIILLFGVNPITIGASVALTLYVCLLLNWKSVSAVALFTAIYMTQFLQMDASGNPDVGITFLLRFAALGSGVMVAIIYNYIFSLFQYRQISNKRSIFLMKQVLANMASMKEALKNQVGKACQSLRGSLIETSNSIEWVSSHFDGMIKESGRSFFYTPLQIETLNRSKERIMELRNIAHLLYDVVFVLEVNTLNDGDAKALASYTESYINLIMDNLGSLKAYLEGNEVTTKPIFKTIEEPMVFGSVSEDRIIKNLCDINESINRMIQYS